MLQITTCGSEHVCVCCVQRERMVEVCDGWISHQKYRSNIKTMYKTSVYAIKTG